MFQASKFFDLEFLLYSLWQLHLDSETLIFFEFFLSMRLYYVVAKLNNCRVPSSVVLHLDVLLGDSRQPSGAVEIIGSSRLV